MTLDVRQGLRRQETTIGLSMVVGVPGREDTRHVQGSRFGCRGCSVWISCGRAKRSSHDCRTGPWRCVAVGGEGGMM